MRLAVFVDQIFWFDGECYSTNAAFIKYIIGFTPYFEKIVFYGRVSEEKKRESYALDPHKTEVCALPFYEDIYSLRRLQGFSIIANIFRVLAREANNWELVWLCVPNPIALFAAYLCKRKNKPFFMMVRQNLIEQVRYRSSRFQKIPAMSIVYLLEMIFRSLAKNHLTFTVGHEMYLTYKKKGGPVFECCVSLISQQDAYRWRQLERKHNESAQKIQLLNVGRLDPEKGLEHLINALKLLIQEYRLDAVLHLVGTGQMEKALRTQVVNLELEHYVHFHGYVAHGEKLFDLYRSASIFVLPSLQGEGLPQVLLEAMACGIPLVATNVAGIPYLINSGFNGLLIEPAQPSQIAEAILRLSGDKNLRTQLIENGFQTVLKHTEEAERERILTILHQYRLWPQPVL